MTRLLVLGTGLLGTSIGLAARAAGHQVLLSDPSPTAVALAADLGAGQALTGDAPAPQVVVVAAPPDVTAAVVQKALADYPDAVVTDVASVKQSILSDLESAVAADQLRRYVGSHPMAGRERSGAVSARGDLFVGRSWVICPHPGCDPAAVQAVTALATDLRAQVTTLTPIAHDAAVAAVSHVPQVAASLVAARLAELGDEALALSGQGVRDVTRIAASDPMLWTQILAGNAAEVLAVLDALAGDLDQVRSALRQVSEDGSAGGRGTLARTVAAGQLGQSRIPGKHGGPQTPYASLVVLVPDEPGRLAALFADIGRAGVNLEDVRMDHVEGADVGLAEVWVLPAAAPVLEQALAASGWRVHQG
ncbi:prephenate dehydrogenase [Dermacoccaceae bacterium W4C1]